MSGNQAPHRNPSHHGIEGNEIADEAKQAGRPRSGVDRLQGPAQHRQKETFPATEIPRQLQAGLLGEKVDGGPGLGKLAKTGNRGRP